jgi:hypothetical protein
MAAADLSTHSPVRLRRFWPLLIVALALAAVATWLAWRYTAPVEIVLASDVGDLPFEVAIEPPVVQAQPGEVVSVTYRIHNTHVLPLEAFGRIEIEPEESAGQVQIFYTRCGGLNTFQNNTSENYEVVFRVEAAGLSGASRIVLRHAFVRAAPPRS